MKTEKLNRKQSNKVQRELRKKVTEKMLDNELYRFTTMETKQLLSRVKRLKNPIKAEACRIMAKWCGVPAIFRAARQKRNELYA